VHFSRDPTPTGASSGKNVPAHGSLLGALTDRRNLH
jgi:hypothetical protein